MARSSPLDPLHDRAGALALPYGPGDSPIRVVQTYGDLALEYAAIRKAGALFDWPQRGTLEISGADRIGFLNRMVTQELKGLGAGGSCRSFWLNRKGRIDADLTLVELGDRMLALVDALAAERAARGLADFVIAEDVHIVDASPAYHHLALHGPGAWALLAAASAGSAPGAVPLPPDGAACIEIAGASVTAVRDDPCGETGCSLVVETSRVGDVYGRLLEFARQHEPEPEVRAAASSDGSAWLRPAGWLAFNTARIEAGTPLYQIDFGPDSLPHESGVLHDRVSFKKGCYLGQEVVARMESRGHSKRTLAGLRCFDPAGGGDGFERAMPVTGGGVFADPEATEPVGVVTSATLSPMLGAESICFAALKPGHAAPGTTLAVEAEGSRLRAVVQPRLRFLPDRSP